MENKTHLLVITVSRLPESTEIDAVIRHLYAWKALHVQVLSTVTEEGTPAYTLMVEVNDEHEWILARGLAETYGIARYHQLTSTLRYQPIATTKRPIVATCQEKQVGMTVRFDLIGTEREPLFVRVQDADLATLQEYIAQTFDRAVSASELRDRLERLLMREDGFVLDLGK